MTDEIVSCILFEFVHHASLPVGKPLGLRAQWRSMATGGYGRGLMAPGSDIDLPVPAALRSKQRGGEQVAEADLVLPVGPGAEGRPRHPLGGDENASARPRRT